MRCTALAMDIADRNFAYRGAVPRCQCGNEAVQLAIQRNLIDDLAAIRFEGSSEIVDIHAAEFRHQPVGAARWKSAHYEIIDALFAPTAHDVVPFADLLQKYWNVVRIVLQIAIHGNDVLTGSVIESCSQSGGLTKVSTQLDDGDAAVYGSDFA